MITKRHKEFPAIRLVELEKEREVLLDLLRKRKKEKEKYAQAFPILAKPDEIDKMFCDIENPCTPTLTVDTNLFLHEEALKQKAEDVVMDVLFCSPEECEKTLDMTSIVVKDPCRTVLLERDTPVVNAEDTVPLVDKPTFYQKVRKYLGDLWRQKTNT